MNSNKNWIKGIDYPEWMGERSLATLNGGYLFENESPKMAMERIARRVNELVPEDAYDGDLEQSVFNALWNQEISPSSPVWSNFGLDRGLPISCVTGNTMIETSNGPKRADQIDLTDMVLTHKNRFKRVTAIMPTKDREDIWELRVAGLDNLTLSLTGDHLVKTDIGWTRVDKLSLKKSRVAINKNYLDACDDFLDDGLYYVNIESLAKTSRVEDVFDFTVEEDHSFSCSGIVVHNCFNSHVDDSIAGIYSTLAENAMMTKLGGGTSSYWGEVRPRGSEISNESGSTGGPFEFIQNFDSMINKVSQGNCYEDGTHVLTDKGFKDFKDVDPKEDKIIQVNSLGERTETSDYELVEKTVQEDLLRFFNKETLEALCTVTSSHRMVVQLFNESENKYNESLEIILAKDLFSSKKKFRFVTTRKGEAITYIESDQIVYSHVYHTGKVRCAVVPTGKLIVRTSKNREFVCGNTRRGSHAVYIDFSHPDVEEFLGIKQVGNPVQNLFLGISIKQSDIDSIYNKDPRSLKVWSKILESRNRTGLPYLQFYDNANDGESTPPWYGLENSKIKASNLCVEIMLPSNEQESFVCCLLSMNAITFDKWKDKDSVRIANIMLEAILEDFIIKTTGVNELKKARRFAQRHRAVGLG